MNMPSMLRKLLKIARVCAVLCAVLWVALAVNAYTSPVVVVHYAADAKEPVVYFFDEPAAHVIRGTMQPGESLSFRTPRDPYPGFVAIVSLPLASRDGVEIEPPFSRVDVYVGADTKIARTVKRMDYFARMEPD